MYRTQTFPLRALLDSPQFSESPDGDSPSRASSVGSPASFASLPNFPESNDIDMMADDVSIAGSTSPPSPYNAQFIKPPKPAHLNPTPAAEQFNGGRIPTPMFGSFPQQHALRPAPIAPPSGFLAAPLRHDHAIPSPIREDEMDADFAYAGSQLSQLSFIEEGMDVDDEDVTVSSLSSPSLPRIMTTNLPPPSPTTPRTGRARSGAITERRRFFMGYREDCEKCRMKVPNHFAHFLPVS
jgi:hypothetical protein